MLFNNYYWISLFSLLVVFNLKPCSAVGTYVSTMGKHVIQIPRQTASLEIDLIDFPLAFKMNMTAVGFRTDNSTISSSNSQSLCSLVLPSLELDPVWDYAANTAGITLLEAIGDFILLINTTDLTTIVLAPLPHSPGSFGIIGMIRPNFTAVHPLPSETVFAAVDPTNNILFIATNNTLLSYPLLPSGNRFDGWQDSNSILAYVQHETVNMMKFHDGFLFVLSDKGLEIYNVSDLVKNATVKMQYHIPTFPNLQDVAFNDDNFFILDNKQIVHIFRLSELKQQIANNEVHTLQVATGGRYIGYQEGVLTIVGKTEEDWYIQDFFNISIDNDVNHLTFNLNRFIPIPMHVSAVTWDSTFLYIISGQDTFMIQTGIPASQSPEYDDFAYSYYEVGDITAILSLEQYGFDTIVILERNMISVYTLKVDDPYLQCSPDDSNPDGNYALDITAFLKDCPMKARANDTRPASFCELKQHYDVTLYSSGAPTISSKTELIIGLGGGLILTLIIGLILALVARRYKAKNHELELELRNIKFKKVPQEPEGGDTEGENKDPIKISQFTTPPKHNAQAHVVEISDHPVLNVDDIYGVDPTDTPADNNNNNNEPPKENPEPAAKDKYAQFQDEKI